MTSEPYQQTLFEEMESPSTQSAEASPVRTCPSPASALALKVHDLVCGVSTGDLLTKYDPSSSSWRTSQVSLVSDLDEYSATFPRSGMMLSGTVYQLQPSAPLTGGTGFGSLRTHSIPTPTTQDHIERRSTSSEKLNPATNKSVSLNRFVKFWPTPRASDGKGATTATDCTQRRVESGQANLPEAVVESMRMWPTPTRHIHKEMGYPAEYTRNTVGLGSAVKMWPTPSAGDDRDRGCMKMPAIQRRARLGKQLNLPMVVDPDSGALNADWVEWLMGFPIGWTVVSGFKSPKTSRASSKAKKTEPED